LSDVTECPSAGVRYAPGPGVEPRAISSRFDVEKTNDGAVARVFSGYANNKNSHTLTGIIAPQRP
jgi:hypothetical protein